MVASHTGGGTFSTGRTESWDDDVVAQALEIARESDEASQDATVHGILEGAIIYIWSKIMAQPDSYVMSRREFAVFNFFQARFSGNKLATAARKRYWDNASA